MRKYKKEQLNVKPFYFTAVKLEHEKKIFIFILNQHVNL
jgi:hypothetical protein